MRSPQPDLLPGAAPLRVLALDITDPASIAAVAAEAGEIDVLVNNAGFGAPVPIELTAAETARGLFETNTLGTLAMTQAFLPQFRARRAGVIINVTSSVTLKVLPLVGIYRASKAAVNAFTESLAAEVGQFGVRVHIVLPGRSPRRSSAPMRGRICEVWIIRITRRLFNASWRVSGQLWSGDPCGGCGDCIWLAATDPAAPLYLPAGEDAKAWMAAR